MMLGFLQTAFERFAGRGSAAVTIPAMDGPLGPNTRLEDATSLLDIAMPDNLVQAGDAIYFSSGARLLQFDPVDAQIRKLTVFDHVVTALAVAPDGTLAVGLDNGDILFTGGPRSHEAIKGLPGLRAVCPTALAFADAKTLVLCHGSNRHPPSKWQWSLMENERSGSVWIYDLDSRKATCLAGDLAYPNGLAILAQTREVVISEAWRHHLIRVPLNGGGKPVPVLENLPGYPARMSEAADGGFWLSVFAPRSQLIELVLKEPVYKRKMMREIADPNLWIAPALASGESFLEPLQGGAVKQMGILKPWAPTRSYGLVIRLSPQFLALDSLHSRADGENHGIKSCIDLGEYLLVASTGGNKILSVAVGIG